MFTGVKLPWNVLVFPAASEIGLEIFRSLAMSKEVILHGANMPGLSVAECHYRRLHTLPSIYDPSCLPSLIKLIEREKIDFIFPAYDDVIVWLAERRKDLKAMPLVPHLHLANLCRSKMATYAAFEMILATPKIYSRNDTNIDFPVFVKPDRGQGSQRARVIDDRKSLEHAVEAEPDLIIMEYLRGNEFTIDCFSQKGRGVLFAQSRRRVHTKSGIATISEIVDLPLAHEWASRIDTALQLPGAWFFQVKDDGEGQLKLLEIGPRIAGSMALNRVIGPNFPLLSLYDASGVSLSVAPIRTSMTVFRSLDLHFRHELKIDAVYIDLDDTLILRDQVNTQLVKLIFQLRNGKIPVKLITRHRSDLSATLKRFRLHDLFDDIIHITDPSFPKAAFIKESSAVLIDDSFSERLAASESLGIPCFDAAGSICLLDERA